MNSMIIVFIFVFVFGIVLGSFVNALEYRINEKMTMSGRSICPECKHQLVWRDLVPILSWLFLRGKCRYCGKKISVQYPVVELLSGFSLATLVYVFSRYAIPAEAGIPDYILNANQLHLLGFLAWFVLVSSLSTVLVLVALHDFKTGYVLSYYTYFGMAATLVLVSFTTSGFLGWPQLLTHIYCALGAAAPFAILWAVSRGKWMGAGDIEIAVLLGLVLGWPATIVGLYFAFIVGSIVGLLLVANKKSKLKSEISFGPFLVMGIYFALLFSQQIVNIYVRMFLG